MADRRSSDGRIREQAGDRTRRARWRLIATALIVPLSLTRLTAADISGAWTLEFEMSANRQSYRGECTFAHEGERLTGSCLSGFESLIAVKGAVTGRAVTFQYTTGIDRGATVTFSGELNDAETSISGSLQFVDPDGNSGAGTFTASRP
jgi:hypothetical protein